IRKRKTDKIDAAQLAFLATLPPKFERIYRQIEEIATLKADDMVQRGLTRNLDVLKNEASSLTLTGLADVFGVMANVARRGGGVQMKVRGLREGMISLKVNYEGALRSASMGERTPGDQPGET
ncbi:MAG: hypothetical protein AABZ01_14355, partial [Gemmatimonadota bacterium]